VNNRRRYLVVLLVMTFVQMTAIQAGAEYRIEPGITLSEEYNDNIFITPQNPVHDYILRVVPTIHLVYSAPFWEWDAAYAFDYRSYAQRSKKRDSTSFLTLSNHTSLSPDFFFLDVKDDYRRVSLDTVRDFTQQSLFVNQTDSNAFLITPYLKLNLSSHTTGTVAP
jgi:uncharacterized protein (PEP-CTERM system associated)